MWDRNEEIWVYGFVLEKRVSCSIDDCSHNRNSYVQKGSIPLMLSISLWCF
jgi:hypothetical protein